MGDVQPQRHFAKRDNDHVGILIVVLVVAAAGSAFTMFWRLAKRRSRFLFGTLDEPEATFIGGLRYEDSNGIGGNATVPLTRLSMFASGLRLAGSSRVLRPFLPTIDLAFAEIEKAQAAGRSSPLLRTGVYLKLSALPMSLLFWTSQYDVVLDRLEAHGVPVERLPAPIGFLRWHGP